MRAGLSQPLPDETRVLYVSPLKALSSDIQKNLALPLAGIRDELLMQQLPDVAIRAMVRTGDTPPGERERMRRQPPHILVTTPESLYILLSSDSGRRLLQTVRSVIVDEIHALGRQQTRRASQLVTGAPRHTVEGTSRPRADLHRPLGDTETHRGAGAVSHRQKFLRHREERSEGYCRPFQWGRPLRMKESEITFFAFCRAGNSNAAGTGMCRSGRALRIPGWNDSELLLDTLKQQTPVGTQQLGVVLGAHGAAEKIALHDVAALIAQEARLFHGLHAFGHH